jgi:predicted XRE-type DNA-binding protein
MKSVSSKASHVVKGDVFDALGLSATESAELRVKADLLDAILKEIQRKGYKQVQLVALLDEHQPTVSNLMNGKLASVSIEKLIRYGTRLGLHTTLKIKRGPSRLKIPAQPRNPKRQAHAIVA